MMLLLMALAAAESQQPLGPPPIPALQIEAPADLAASRARLESFDQSRLRGVMRVIGLDQPGAAIRVVLASDTSEWARQVPSSTAGFAIGEAGLVVLFPSRSPMYPDDSLEDVLHHEVAHVLIARAAGGHPVPRWFNEGLAMAAERTWGFEDEARLFRELTLGGGPGLDEVNTLFEQSDSARARAYALSGAFVRDLIRYHGTAAPGAVLARVAAGASFENAFAAVIGLTVVEAERAFWNRHRFWSRWGPFLTTSTALWMLVTLIALVAIVRRRQKSARLRKQWAEEGLDE
jgi:hypothetical protein